MNSKLILWSITVSLGGFLFGMDVAVISGAEQDIQRLWNLNTLQHGLAVAIALYGTVIGAGFGGLPSDKFGRKRTLQWIAFLFIISALGSAIAPEVNTFMLFRFFGGLSIGASSVVAPIYISEIAPPKYRGRMGISFQLNIVLGILVAYVSNYFLAGIPDDWRWMLGIVAIPAVLFFVLLFLTPETPRWLILHKGNMVEARKIIAYTDPQVDKVVDEIVQSKTDQHGVEDKFFSKKFKTPILLAFLFAVFNQLSGINAIIYYSPRIFEMTGLGTNSSLLSTAGLGAINFAFTLLAMNFIDRIGRRTLMLIGSFGLIFTLAMVSYSFYAANFGGWAVPVFLFIYIAFFAFSQGAVIWVFISEIFPNQVRAKGQTLGSATHWIMATIIAIVGQP